MAFNFKTATPVTSGLTDSFLYFGAESQAEADPDIYTLLALKNYVLADVESDITIGSTAIVGGTTTRILYDNAGVVGEYTLTGTGTVVAMQTSPSFLTGITTPVATITQGTITDPALQIDGTVTWNDAADTFTAWKLNVTNTASASASLLLDLQVGGTSELTVRKDGFMTVGGPLLVEGTQGAAGAFGVEYNGSAEVVLGASFFLGWGSSGISSPDTKLYRDAANTLALRNGSNAQAFNIYNTYTNGSEYEKLTIVGFSNVFYIASQQAGAGVARQLVLRTDGAANLTFGTNTTERWNVGGSTGHFLAHVDNTYDIGASGATRPRTGYFGTSVVTPLLSLSGETLLVSDAANTLALRNSTNAQTFRVYNTESSSLTNYERLALQTGSGYVEIAAETAGTGTDNLTVRLTAAGTGVVAARSTLHLGTATGQTMLTTRFGQCYFGGGSEGDISQTSWCIDAQNAEFRGRSGNLIGWTSSGTSAAAALDTILARDAANTLALRNSTNAQTLRVYNTYTDASNYERGAIYWSSNVFTIAAEEAGSGTQRNVQIGNGLSSIFLNADGGTTAIMVRANGTNLAMFGNTAGADGNETIRLGSARNIGWSSAANVTDSVSDVKLYRDAAATLALRNSTNAQTFRVYNTESSSLTNYERVSLNWDTNIFKISSQAGGTGSLRTIQVVVPNSTQAAFAVNPTTNSGWTEAQVNNGGVSIQLQAYSDGNVGRIGCRSNTGVQLTTNDATRWEMQAAGHLIAGTDNTYDIGASGATRPRTGYFGTSLVSPILSRTAPVTETNSTHTVATTTTSLIANRAGDITVTLPAAASFPGRELFIKTIQAQTVTSNASNVVPLGDSAAGTAILPATDGAWCLLISDGTNWIKMAGSEV